MFHPHERILVMGKLQTTPPSNPRKQWEHSLPGWPGMSGGMMGILDSVSNLNPPARAKVFGMCKFIIVGQEATLTIRSQRWRLWGENEHHGSFHPNYDRYHFR